MPAVALGAFVWGTPEMSERAASRKLRPRFDKWVKDGASPPIENVLLDAQSTSTSFPLTLSVDDVGSFKGISDAIYPRKNIRSIAEAQPVWNPALVSIDWKTPTAFRDMTKIAAIGHIQALAFSAARKSTVPVFLSDMVTGFRVWLVIGTGLYHLHPDGGSLTLAEGVALTRLILSRLNADCEFSVVDGALEFSAAPGGSRHDVLRPGKSGGAAGGSSSGGAAEPAPGGDSGLSRGGPAGSRCEMHSVTPGPSLIDEGGDDGGDDGEDDSPETLFLQIAAEFRERGGIQLDFD